MSKNNKMNGKIQRGFTSEDFNKSFSDFSNSNLLENLKSTDAQIRTSAAKLLGQRKYFKAVECLCEMLKVEKKLYTKIAISESLIEIGIPSVVPLINLLGKIGSNQHKKLPDKPFNKWNYPLPRDLAARIIAKIGTIALPSLNKILENGNSFQITEAIDAIGNISFYFNDNRSFDALKNCLNSYSKDDIIVWKIIRALEAFSSDESINILRRYLKESKYKELRWEAARSLGQINNKKSRIILKDALNTESNKEVRNTINMALNKKK